MCGAIGLIFEKERDDIGLIAADLLKMLEYRGYDSTGAAIQGQEEKVWLAKGVGAPSRMVQKLGIVDQRGLIFCGQVRWATFGAVDEANSQPHEVKCKAHLYGAHNGNVTNCDALKAWLQGEGHLVKSDNDGEMVVHTIEHCFGLALESIPEEKRGETDVRREAMRTAIAQAIGKIEGSFAAVVVDPVSRTIFAMKLGSSLYFGFGQDEKGGSFGIASSDLSSVLHLTRILIPLNEGELVEFSARHRSVYQLKDESKKPLPLPSPLERSPIRSRLQTDETTLLPPFKTFMAQEISSQEFTVRRVVERFLGGTESEKKILPFLHQDQKALSTFRQDIEQLADLFSDEDISLAFKKITRSREFIQILSAIPAALKKEILFLSPEKLIQSLVSKEAGMLGDLAAAAKSDEERAAIRLIDLIFDVDETSHFASVTDRFTEICLNSVSRRGRLFVVCCGSSYHAAKTASVFFNELAHAELIPLLPGDFRAQYSGSIRPEDVFIAVSQSGETKDLIDVIDAIMIRHPDVCRISIVNNVSSTLGQEKCHLVIPLLCGPEIAVPATKSFLNQIALFYCLALKLARRRSEVPASRQHPNRVEVTDVTKLHCSTAASENRDDPEVLQNDPEKKISLSTSTFSSTAADIDSDAIRIRYEKLRTLPDLIRASIDATEVEVEAAAQQLYLAPSIHLLATRITSIAMEGALKIREVVLNHAQGFEASEFKHGPNTLLGVNTLYGPREVNALLRSLGQQLDTILKRAAAKQIHPSTEHSSSLDDKPTDSTSQAVSLNETTSVISSSQADDSERSLEWRRLVQAATDGVFSIGRHFALKPEEESLFESLFDKDALFESLQSDYPLIFITGPSERDVSLTVSQINTHKIRGASPFVIAEEDPALRAAAEKSPTDNPAYRWGYLVLPRTGDTLMTIFSASVVLQRLALRMSELKSQYLDRIGFRNHGVHPDVPKNVSKSITVD